MAKYKNKYLVVQEKSKELFGHKLIVTQVDVSGKDKYSIGKDWGKLEDKYPSSHYVVILTETNENRREFQDEPKIIENEK